MSSDHPASMIGIVFSKDRAMQLDATLRSFFLHCADPGQVVLKVIFAGSSEFFLRQYGELKLEYRGVDFIAQTEFKRDVYDLLGIPLSIWGRLALRFGAAQHWAHRHVLFLVDDNIFVRDFRLSDAADALALEKTALGFSLQAGTNINYCYPLDISVQFPAYLPVLGDVIKYRWTEFGDGLDYPLEVSSSIYRQEDIAKLIARLDFFNPNTLEAQMADRAGEFRKSHPYLLSYNQSVTFCNPINRVQNTYANRAGDRPKDSADALARLFEAGHRIDVKAYNNLVPNACHQIVDITLMN